MFTVYKITNENCIVNVNTNNINNQCYIGSSIRVEQRWKQHKNNSKNPNNASYYYPLYCAFRKYGIDNFSFEILRNDFLSVEEMEQYEYEMIIQYDSTNADCGYNQTIFTHSNQIANENLQKYLAQVSQPCAKVDIYNNILEVYQSYSEAARVNIQKENCSSVIRDICKGITSSYRGMYFRDLDDEGNIIPLPFRAQKSRKTLVGINIENPTEERFFESISAAATELSTDRHSIAQCIQGEKRYSIIKGYILREIDLYGNIIENSIDIEQRIQEFNENNPVINGERHNITEWCNIYNISRQSYHYRRKNGMGVVEAITAPKRR